LSDQFHNHVIPVYRTEDNMWSCQWM